MVISNTNDLITRFSRFTKAKRKSGYWSSYVSLSQKKPINLTTPLFTTVSYLWSCHHYHNVLHYSLPNHQPDPAPLPYSPRYRIPFNVVNLTQPPATVPPPLPTCGRGRWTRRGPASWSSASRGSGRRACDARAESSPARGPPRQSPERKDYGRKGYCSRIIDIWYQYTSCKRNALQWTTNGVRVGYSSLHILLFPSKTTVSPRIDNWLTYRTQSINN